MFQTPFKHSSTWRELHRSRTRELTDENCTDENFLTRTLLQEFTHTLCLVIDLFPQTKSKETITDATVKHQDGVELWLSWRSIMLMHGAPCIVMHSPWQRVGLHLTETRGSIGYHDESIFVAATYCSVPVVGLRLLNPAEQNQRDLIRSVVRAAW